MEVLRINYDKNEITKKNKASEVCFKCSTCSKFCPVTQHVKKYNSKDSFITQLFQAEKPEALNDVWMCAACEKCIITCPQDANPTEVITNLKEKSYQEGLAPSIIYGLVRQLMEEGSLYSLKVANMSRKRAGLKEVKKNEKAVKELNILAKKVGLERKEVN